MPGKVKVAIIHFAPLELYPPVQNLLRSLEKHTCEITVFSTKNVVKELETFRTVSPFIKIVRLGSSSYRKWIGWRMAHYFHFYCRCVLGLLVARPDRVLYFETLSSFPAYIYRRLINSKAKLFIHYHEYTSTKEYENGMLLSRWFHRLEKKLYPQVDWISHTNMDRIQLFLKDIEPIRLQRISELPNYPPRSWAMEPRSEISHPVKVVYVGAISLTTQFTREFATWVVQQGGKVVWDIYSYNLSDEVVEYLSKLENSWIRFRGGVTYNQLPAVLTEYQVGVVLYKGHIPNYVYNAPNKLFEYLACGLDVWVPDVMKGVGPYLTNGSYPKVVSIDFKSMQTVNLDDLVNRDGLEKKIQSYFCEDVLIELESNLC